MRALSLAERIPNQARRIAEKFETQCLSNFEYPSVEIKKTLAYDSVYQSIVLSFYSVLHRNTELGIQLSFPGFGYSNIAAINDAAFETSVRKVHRLIVSGSVSFHIAFQAFVSFYTQNEVALDLCKGPSIRTPLEFAALLIKSQHINQHHENQIN